MVFGMVLGCARCGGPCQCAVAMAVGGFLWWLCVRCGVEVFLLGLLVLEWWWVCTWRWWLLSVCCGNGGGWCLTVALYAMVVFDDDSVCRSGSGDEVRVVASDSGGSGVLGDRLFDM